MAATLKDGQLTLTGTVGAYFFEDGFTSGDVVYALAQVDDAADLTVFLNSGGGIATEGTAIHALLARRTGNTHIVVDGIAASAASIIAMAGDTITMSLGSIMMIHDPSGMTWGTADEHTKTVEMLDALGNSYAQIYADRSGKTLEECRAIMKAERWFAPQEAVDEGFATDVGTTKSKAVAAFDYRVFAHAPTQLTATAKRKRWSFAAANAATAVAKKPLAKEQTMTDEEQAAAVVAAKSEAQARIKAIMTSAAAKGQEKLAEHFAYSTQDSAEAAIAALTAAAADKTAPATVEPATTTAAEAAQYEARRIAGLATPAGVVETKAKSGLTARIDNHIERNKSA